MIKRWAMKRAIYFTILSILVFLTSIPATIAVAKGPADKIIISGPGLTKPIEITDQQTLQQFRPWVNKFLDAQRGALAVTPKTDRICQVLVYIKDETGQLHVRYAFQYAPGQSGYVYIPGKGDPWYETNIGTVSRGSTIEGHWFYASKEWGDLMQPLLIDTHLSGTTSSVQSSYIELPAQLVGSGLALVVILAGVLIWLFSRRHSRIA
jgi:hypothetical protein